MSESNEPRADGVKRSRYADIPIARMPDQVKTSEESVPQEDSNELYRWDIGASQKAVSTEAPSNSVLEIIEDSRASLESLRSEASFGLETLEGESNKALDSEDSAKGEEPGNRSSENPGAGSVGPASPKHAKSGLSFKQFALGLLCLVAIAAAVVFVDIGLNWGKVYPGIHVGKVDLSGMSASEASAAIQEAYGSRVATARISICADEETEHRLLAGESVEEHNTDEEISADEAARNRKLWTTNADALQARLATEEVVDRALKLGREDGGLVTRLSALGFGITIEPSVQMNEASLEELAYAIDRAIGEPRQDCGISITDGTAVATEGRDGKEVDRIWLASELSELFLADTQEKTLVPTAKEAPMRINMEQAQAVADRVNAGIANGARFTCGEAQWQANPLELSTLIRSKVVRAGATDDIAPNLDDETPTWELQAFYDASATKNAILSKLNMGLADKNMSVHFEVDDGKVSVSIGETDTLPEVGKAVENLEEATLGESAPAATPEITVQATEAPSTMSVEAALDYGVITTISEFETEYTGGATARNHNIHLAADILDNSVISADGGSWSFNEVAGDCNIEERGFQGAGAIVNGETVDEIGGGICQVATTVFNAVYEAGYPIDYRRNHSLYIASYPAGRDAAINYPDLDLLWHNDTQNDILLKTSYTDTSVTVSLIGVDPGYLVETQAGEYEAGAPFATQYRDTTDLAEGEERLIQVGQDGSSIKVTRIVTNGGGEILREDVFESVYDAKDEIIEVGVSA